MTSGNLNISFTIEDGLARLMCNGRIFAEMGCASQNMKLEFRTESGIPFVFIDVTPIPQNGRLETYWLPGITLSRTELCDPWKMRALGTGGLTAVDGHHGSYMYLALAEPVTRRGVVVAWLTSLKGSGTVSSFFSEGSAAVAPALDYFCEASEDARPPAETLVIGCFDDCRLGLEAYADAVARRFDIHLPPQISGYCTWYADRHEWSGDEASTQAFAETVEKLGLVKWGLSFYQIDDMWQDGELFNGPAKNFSRVNPDGPYPNGMESSARRLSAAGIRPGLWFMPFSGTARGEWWADKRELFVKRPDGEPYEQAWSENPLDMSNPAAVDYMRSIVRRMTSEWGFRYLKPDGISAALGYRLSPDGDLKPDDYGRQLFHDRTFTGVEAYRAGFKALREAAGKDVFILGCGVGGTTRVMGANYGLTDAARVGPDNGPWERRYMLGVKPASFRYFYNGRVWYNDPDPVYLRDSRPVGQARLFASWTAIAGMFWNFSDWIPDLSEERLEILRRTIAPNTCRNVRPVDLFETDLPRMWHLEQDGRHVFDFCNWDTRETAVFDIDAEYAGLDPEKSYVGFDFWRKEFSGPFRGNLRVSVPPVDVAVVAVREVTDHPIVLSTSRHVASPVFDVTGEEWTDNTLSGTSKTVPGDTYELRVFAPDGFSCSSATAGGLPAEVRQEGNFIRVTFSVHSESTFWVLSFTCAS